MYIFVVGFSNLRRMNENMNKITCVEWLENVKKKIPITGTIFILLILKLRFLSIDLIRVITLRIFKDIYHSASGIYQKKILGHYLEKSNYKYIWCTV